MKLYFLELSVVDWPPCLCRTFDHRDGLTCACETVSCWMHYVAMMYIYICITFCDSSLGLYACDFRIKPCFIYLSEMMIWEIAMECQMCCIIFSVLISLQLTCLYLVLKHNFAKRMCHFRCGMGFTELICNPVESTGK